MNPEEQNHAARVRIIKSLVSRDASERRRAEQQLAWYDLNTVEELISLLNAELERGKNRRRIVRRSRWAMVAAYLFWLLLSSDRALGLPGPAIILLFGLMGSVELRWSQLDRSFQRGIAVALSRFDDLAMLPPLIDLYCADNRDLIVPVLSRLLVRLHATDAALLKAQQRRRLGLELMNCNNHLAFDSVNVAFLLAILKAWEQIGDESAIDDVKHVAFYGLNRRVRDAASECLPYLQERVDRMRVGSTLLRAAAQTQSPAELLRPSNAVANEDPKQLLHPHT